jgi:His/Glu/Gln/Arg/opine family amino acid ABC transporter permease subunit
VKTADSEVGRYKCLTTADSEVGRYKCLTTADSEVGRYKCLKTADSEVGRYKCLKTADSEVGRYKMKTADSEVGRYKCLTTADSEFGRYKCLKTADSEVGRYKCLTTADSEVGRYKMKTADSEVGRYNCLKTADSEVGRYNCLKTADSEVGRYKMKTAASEVGRYKCLTTADSEVGRYKCLTTADSEVGRYKMKTADSEVGRYRMVAWRFHFLVMLVGFFTLGGSAAGETIRVGVDATFPPFEYMEEGVPAGFEVALGDEIAREMGVEFEWSNISFDAIFLALENDRFDMVMSSVTITPERSERFLFSRPYTEAGQVIAVRVDSEGISSFDDLRGRRIGVQLNTTGMLKAQELPEATLIKHDAINLALLDLKNGRVDAVINDRPVTEYMLQGDEFAGLKIVGDVLTEEYYGAVIRKGDVGLKVRVDAALEAISADGRYDALWRKWVLNEESYTIPAVGGTTDGVEGAESVLPGGRWARAKSVFLDLLGGLKLTALLTLGAFGMGLPAGVLVAVARLARNPVLSRVFGLYVELIRGTPLMVQLFFLYFVLAKYVSLEQVPAAIVALSVNVSAYAAEAIRAGILSLPSGQMEAARSIGLTHAQGLRFVVLPQALRNSVPPLTNELVALIKDTSLVTVIALGELTQTGRELASRFANPTLIWPMVAMMYLALTWPLSRLSLWLEGLLSKHRRHVAV